MSLTDSPAPETETLSRLFSSKESRDARKALRRLFGYDDFRPGQGEVIEAILAGEDVFAVMPTGSGKSMCYQLPAALDGGLTVVVSPLIALMRDQVRQMQAIGIAAASLNSANDEAEGREAWRQLVSGELSLLFVSPERLAGEGLLQRLRELGVRRLAIDEAHCVSQWGHDFRPEYRQLTRVREVLGDVQVVALTATADRATRDDIAAQLFPKPPRSFVHSFDRPNLSLRFAVKDRPRSQIADFLAGHKGGSGIVYAASRDRTESLAAHLETKGHRALPYHAGLEQSVRSRHQDIFLQEDGVVMVATIAFGMGINKPDVRFVVHADMPGGVEAYYQEIGRAGRDGLPADTLTLYSLEDMAFRRRQIDEKDVDPERHRVEHQRLTAMTDLCELATCRRQALLAYFGEESGPCGSCDLCLEGARLYDAQTDAQKVLSAVARTGQRFGAGHLADVLLGQETDAVKRHGHQELKTFGAGKERSRRSWSAIVRQLFAAGALSEAGEHGGFAMTQKGVDVLFGREPIRLRVQDESTARRDRGGDRNNRADGLDGETAALFEHLRKRRLQLAREEKVAAYVIFPDRTLIDMAERKPLTLDEMRRVQGVGEAKLSRYGDAFLEAISHFSPA
ncbi:ATP-dependent DNA helicase RecQ [Faunimonas pinastri]|uniref:DNA helicase RecQ n=1 Tax=Faunimonas pinastri TaxID=1855383 RepID=A0A1H9HQT8_9HYPH|nr:DNA helicase RecQ [Faunimonas pinastri]SEQ64709.1 ATP-dependent DNA helicase RecQ [Faunimonas pinastri]